MSHLSIPLTQLIHENFSIVMDFVYSRVPLSKMVEDNFKGEWKYLNKALFEYSHRRAEKACIELAVFLRTLDDEQPNSEYLAKRGWSFGIVVSKTNKTTPLKARDVSNQILHAKSLGWKISETEKPILICHAREKERFLRAEIDIIALAGYCGNIMS